MAGAERKLWVTLTVIIGLLGIDVCGVESETRSKFKAAVYEHSVIMPPDPKKVVSRAEALELMRRNLAVYEEQARAAKAQGADIIVFPEDGIYGVAFTRKSMEPYLEFIPDPKVVSWVPCDDPTRFKDTEVQASLSCMAKQNGIYLIANIGDRQPCHPQVNANCRSDGHFQYNTDVAFDPTGLLVARYHKKNLFFEFQFDEPREAEVISFETPFGRWGMFTCFDIMFFAPAVEAIAKGGIANVAFPTAWMDALPLLASVQFHSAFARGHGVNFLAANIHWPEKRFHGSGIYTPKGMAGFYHNASLSSQPLLIVKEIDTLAKPTPERATKAGSDVDTTISVLDLSSTFRVQADRVTDTQTGHAETNEIAFVSELFHDLFNFVQVSEPAGSLQVCHHNVCCILDYVLTKDPQNDDLFAFGAFDGLHTYEGQYYLQICALVRCANRSHQSCGSPTNQSSTLFQRLSMRGRFDTEYLYPEVLLTSPGNYLRLAEADEWNFREQVITSDKGFSHPLLAAAIFGRDYSRDDPGSPQKFTSVAPAVTALHVPHALILMVLASLMLGTLC